MSGYRRWWHWLALTPVFGIAIELLLPFMPGLDGDGTRTGYELRFTWGGVRFIAELTAWQIVCFAAGWFAKRLVSLRTG
ncbi:MAG: hypothetical protein QM698_06420 [Micropepsaceae bacterium]